jgi:hypothetical protein
MIFAQVCPPRGSRGALGCGPDACPEGIDGLREALSRRPFRQEGHHRRVQLSEGCLIAVEWFQRIANLAFHPALLERQQDPPCFLKDLLGSAQDKSSSPAVVEASVMHTLRRDERADKASSIQDDVSSVVFDRL